MSDDLSKTESENLSASQESDSLHCIDSILDDDDSDTCEKTTEKQVEQNVEINRRTKKAACKSDESDKEKDKDSNSEQKLKKKKKRNLWWLKISIISFILAAFFSFLSDLTSSFGNLIVILLLLIFLVLGSIIFDGIGVAVTSCDLAPLLSMSSRKVYGAKTAVKRFKYMQRRYRGYFRNYFRWLFDSHSFRNIENFTVGKSAAYYYTDFQFGCCRYNRRKGDIKRSSNKEQ